MTFMAWHLLEHCGSDLIHVSGCRYNHLALGGWLRVIDVRHGVAAAGDTAALQYGPELCQFGCLLGADERVLTPKT